MKCQSLFSQETKTNNINSSSAELAQMVVKFKKFYLVILGSAHFSRCWVQLEK